ncbi:MAG: hypothetical protein P9L92_15540 [Candidatus Electryonea clarkiae]|nr:hypothetical protein [Candidatus Electryonea clarkiae]MDP8288443.1 hypothetical protein [Candidatus Electryonea clarkiae]
MKAFHENINEYRKQLKNGNIQEGYKGLMEYIRDLKLHLKKNHPDYFVSSSVQPGYMDYSYFYFFPKSLKNLKLKIAILFVHETFTFEVWLLGYNKQVQKKYWKLFRESDWNKYNLASTTEGVYSIIDHTLIDNPDFSDLDTLTSHIERGILKFIKDVENFLSEH